MYRITSAKLEEAVEFCWSYQRGITKARAEGWPQFRLRGWVECQRQLWRRFSAGIRSSANAIFQEQINEQLATPPEQRNPNQPVWLNEHYNFRPNRHGTTSSALLGGD